MMQQSLRTVGAVADIWAEAPVAYKRRIALQGRPTQALELPEWLVRGVLIPAGIVVSAPVYLVFFAIAAVIYPLHAVRRRIVR